MSITFERSDLQSPFPHWTPAPTRRSISSLTHGIGFQDDFKVITNLHCGEPKGGGGRPNPFQGVRQLDAASGRMNCRLSHATVVLTCVLVVRGAPNSTGYALTRSILWSFPRAVRVPSLPHQITFKPIFKGHALCYRCAKQKRSRKCSSVCGQVIRTASLTFATFEHITFEKNWYAKKPTKYPEAEIQVGKQNWPQRVRCRRLWMRRC